MNVFRVLKNNWKKTTLATVIGGIGVNYGLDKYRESLLLRAYCHEAKKYGDEIFNGGGKIRKVTVFLNPAANKGKGKAIFEKNVAPLLHLAGLEVTIIKTEYEGQAKKYMEVLDNTDAILVAGGDGTLSEVVTGLLRRSDEETFSQISIGVIPLGKTNTMAKQLCPLGSSQLQQMAELTMAAIRNITRAVDVIHVVGNNEKSVFAVSGFQWGSFTDSEIAKAKYWYFGPLKHRLSYIVTALRNWPPTNKARLSYTLPCDGCSQCYKAPVQPQWKWWHLFLSPQRQVSTVDYSAIVNSNCGVMHSEDLLLSQLTVSVNNNPQTGPQQVPKSMRIDVTDDSITKSDFIRRGWSMLRKSVDSETSDEKYSCDRELLVKEFLLTPIDKNSQGDRRDQELWFLLDNERFELMDISGRLLPDKLHFFCSSALTIPAESPELKML